MYCAHSFAHFGSHLPLPLPQPLPASAPAPPRTPAGLTLSACYVCICSIITAYLRSILGTHEILMDLWPGRSPLDLASGPWTKLNRTRNRNRPHWTLPTKCSASRVVSSALRFGIYDLRFGHWDQALCVWHKAQKSPKLGSGLTLTWPVYMKIHSGFLHYIHLHFSISPSLSLSLCFDVFLLLLFFSRFPQRFLRTFHSTSSCVVA